MFKSLCFITVASSAFAIMHPFHESMRQWKELVNDSHMGILNEMVEKIERTERGFCVYTRTQAMEVDIHFTGNHGMCGPAQFKFEFFYPQDIRLNPEERQRIPSN